jgi:hypothetical protein
MFDDYDLEIIAAAQQAQAALLEQFLFVFLSVVAATSALALLTAGMVWEALKPAWSGRATRMWPRAAFNFNPQLSTRRIAMKRIALFVATLFLFTLAAQAQNQQPAATNGAVWVITEYRFKPGTGNAQNYTKFLREHRVHILAEQKAQGLILNYQHFHNDTTGGPHEVQLVEAISYRNYNDALDTGSNEERVKKLREILIKHYGSLENMQKTVEPNQNYVEVIRRYVLHEMTFNPAKAAASGN